MSAILEIKNLSKSFGDIKALDDVSLSIDKGEFVFLTGASGAGKTTLIRTILKELIPDSGEIIFDGESLSAMKRKHIPKHRRRIGVVFQDYKLLYERTIRENIEVALAVVGVNRKEWIERVGAVLKLVGLEGRSGLFPAQLSGGELQRTTIARALVVNPTIILADEPTGNLDWDTADTILELLDKINKDGKTIVVSTHHKIIVERMKKREISLDKGKLASNEKKEKAKPKKKSKTEEKQKSKSEEKPKSKSNEEPKSKPEADTEKSEAEK
jgi:cell division transport system ATP-binding protein